MRPADINAHQTSAEVVQLGDTQQQQHGTVQAWWGDGAPLKHSNLAGTMPSVSMGSGSPDAQQPGIKGLPVLGPPLDTPAAAAAAAAPACRAEGHMPCGPAPLGTDAGAQQQLHHGWPGGNPAAPHHQAAPAIGMPGASGAAWESAGGGPSVPAAGPMVLGSSPEGCPMAGGDGTTFLQLPTTQRTLSWSEAQKLLSRWDSGASTQEVARLGVSPTHQQQQLLLAALQQQDTSPLLPQLQYQDTVPSTLAAAADSVEAEGCSSGRSSTDGSNRAQQRGAPPAAAAARRTKAVKQAAASPSKAAAAAAVAGAVPSGYIADGAVQSMLRGAPVAAAPSRPHQLPTLPQQQGDAAAAGGLLARPRRPSSHSGRYSVSSCSSGSEDEEEEEGQGSTCVTPRSRPPTQQRNADWDKVAEGEGEGRDIPPQYLVTQAGRAQQWSGGEHGGVPALLPPSADLSAPPAPAAAAAGAGVDLSGAGATHLPAATLQQQAEQLQALLLELAAAQEVLGLEAAAAAAAQPQQQQQQVQQQQVMAGVQVSAAHTPEAAEKAHAHPGHHPPSTTQEDVPMRDQDPGVIWAPEQHPAQGPGPHASGGPGGSPSAEGAGRKRAMCTDSAWLAPHAAAASAPGTSSRGGCAAGPALPQPQQQPYTRDQGVHLHARARSPAAAAAAGGTPPGASPDCDAVHQVFRGAVLQEQQRRAGSGGGVAGGTAAGAGAGADPPAAAATGGMAAPDLADLISRMLEEEVAHQQILVAPHTPSRPG